MKRNHAGELYLGAIIKERYIKGDNGFCELTEDYRMNFYIAKDIEGKMTLYIGEDKYSVIPMSEQDIRKMFAEASLTKVNTDNMEKIVFDITPRLMRVLVGIDEIVPYIEYGEHYDRISIDVEATLKKAGY